MKPNKSLAWSYSCLAVAGLFAISLTCHSVGAQAAPLSLLRQNSTSPKLQVTSASPVVLSPESGPWNLSAYQSVLFKVTNTSKEPVTVWARAENPGSKGTTDSCRTAINLEAGKTQTITLRLMRRPQDPTYAPFKPFFMYFKDINVRDNTVDASQIGNLTVWLEPSDAGKTVVVQSVMAAGKGVAGAPAFFPFVDKYGQYKHTDWPDKIYSDADFAARRQKEEQEMKAYPGPASWDQWGGWKDGPKQEATGYFYPKKVDDKWWLVDPEGHLFWSYGPTGVGFGERTPVSDRENWFAELPAKDGEFGRYWGEGKNARFMYYQDKQYRSFDFSGANAQRNYGKNWETATADFMHRRLRNWGFNTIGNWSNSTVMLRRKTPYTVAIHYGGPQLQHIPDVFDPAFEQTLDERMNKEIGTTAGDPWNLGYFVDNEWTWGHQSDGASVTHGALKAAETSVSKQVFIADLKAKYNEIGALNTAWGSNYESWDALLKSRDLPDTKNAQVQRDCGEFGLKFADKYFSTARAAVKRVAPNNLYLGCRFHGHIDGSLVKIAAKYCDVISYNIYEAPDGRLNQYRGVVDKPFIVGEFGISSDTGQMPWRGEVYSVEPTVRLRAMESWLRKGFSYPALVGAHFFQFRDQPLSGRGDGEATLRGLVNTADTPHFDLVQLNRRLGYNLYEIRSGKTVQ